MIYLSIAYFLVCCLAICLISLPRGNDIFELIYGHNIRYFCPQGRIHPRFYGKKRMKRVKMGENLQINLFFKYWAYL